MIGVALLVAIGIGLLALGVVVTARRASLDYEALRRKLGRPGPGRLVYAVPDGLDPATVVAALRHAGYDAAEEGGSHRVVVLCPDGRTSAEAHVRDVIAAVGRGQ